MESLFFYKGMAKVYDLLDVIYFRDKNHNPRIAVNDYIGPQDEMILDLCTGTAANAIAIAGRNRTATITGIDVSKEMLGIAEKKVKNSGFQNIHLDQMDATKMKFKDHTFNVILISLVLHEISEELADKILQEAKRVLKPGGKLLVIEWEKPQNPQNPCKKLLFYFIWKLEPKGFEDFLRLDMKDYFHRFGLQLYDIKHCDYTKVIDIRKEL